MPVFEVILRRARAVALSVGGSLLSSRASARGRRDCCSISRVLFIIGRYKNATARQMESRCADCEHTRFQCFGCRQVDKVIAKSKREAAARESAAKRPCTQELQKQQLFLSRARAQFDIKTVPRDGHCAFNAFAAGYNKLKGSQLTMQEVRNAVVP